MYLASPSRGLGRAICARCIDREAPDGNDIRIVCTAQGCESAPEYVLEDRFVACQRFALCEHHFLGYEGVIDQVLRIPEQSTGHDTVVEGSSIDSWHADASGCGGPVQELEREGGSDCDQ